MMLIRLTLAAAVTAFVVGSISATTVEAGEHTTTVVASVNEDMGWQLVQTDDMGWQ
ncbi:hypothetical protein [Streptomyces sp. NRRL B-24720]|uniref:hypothetical protein n=1 Tax=Streptomyces sp. NRRL B-24720 TaxID=1476876 RepID=UPI000B15FE4D|nr:hypothetical protein [Streptomyces sp. NRRL B-24720]